ncbi:MAG TPA: T9SS type A sorting domain-containing protein, partial [Bacteroidota bacterium]|nr:T9SS type A sorting domain-containing protein [Bacteroidota bacterium]
QWANDTVEVEIGQFQTPSWPTYKMPIRLRINYADSTDTTVVVLDSLRLQTFRIPLSRPLQHVEFDPDNWILKKMFPWPVYVRETEQPLAIGLRQNYPNPFNPTTTIVFTLPSQSTNIAEGRGRVGSYVTLKVYDVLGRDVATLVNQRLGPGTYTAIFDGAGLASGMYVYRLEANGHVLSHKMLLLK